jgi:RecB family exonuclease
LIAERFGHASREQFDLPPREETKARERADAAVAWLEREGWTVIEVEAERTATVAGVEVIGFLDVIAERDGERAVLDWKTGSWSPSQLATYAALEPDADRYGVVLIADPSNVEVVWWDGSLADWLVQRVCELEAWADTRGVLATKPGRHCRWCPVSDSCPSARV